MAIAYITEFADTGALNPTLAEQPPVAEQTVTYSTSTQSSAFQKNTRVVRLTSDSICSYEFGTNPTATTSNARLAAGQIEYFKLNPSYVTKVAFVTNT